MHTFPFPNISRYCLFTHFWHKGPYSHYLHFDAFCGILGHFSGIFWGILVALAFSALRPHLKGFHRILSFQFTEHIFIEHPLWHDLGLFYNHRNHLPPRSFLSSNHPHCHHHRPHNHHPHHQRCGGEISLPITVRAATVRHLLAGPTASDFVLWCTLRIVYCAPWRPCPRSQCS